MKNNKTNRETLVGITALFGGWILYWMTLISPFFMTTETVSTTALIFISFYTICNIVMWMSCISKNCGKKRFVMKVLTGFVTSEAMLLVPYLIILLVKGII